jgi:hypothetical protein
MTTDTTLLYYDPYDYDVEVDAQSIWKRLRAEAPVYWTRSSSSTRSASTTTCTGLTAADISARMLRETAINRRGKNRTQAQRAVRQTTERSLDVLVLVHDFEIRVLTADGELLRELTLDPTRDYQRQT